jgi:hypothetical protein
MQIIDILHIDEIPENRYHQYCCEPSAEAAVADYAEHHGQVQRVYSVETHGDRRIMMNRTINFHKIAKGYKKGEVMLYAERVLTPEADIALELIKNRKTWEGIYNDKKVIEAAFDLAKMFFDEAEARGYILDVPAPDFGDETDADPS